MEYPSLLTNAEEIFKLSAKQLDPHFCLEPLLDRSTKTAEINKFFAENDKQLKRRGMTLGRLFKDYEKKHPDSFKITRFNVQHESWKQHITPSMHMEHKAGDKHFVDFCW